MEWYTVKTTPVVSGLSLKASEGYLLATAYGSYDGVSDTYSRINIGDKSGSDPDSAITGITFTLYEYQGDMNNISVSDLKKVQETTVTSTDHAYFTVDGTTIRNNATYYLMASYTYNDGATDVETKVYEGNKGKYEGDLINGILQLPSDGRAIEYATAYRNSGVNISFSGEGSNLYNNEEDAESGISYNAIRGSLLVNLRGMVIRVNSVHNIVLTVTDNMSYERTFKYDNCSGVQGNIQGTFALPIDLEGLSPENTYAVTLSAQVYDSNLGTYADEASIGIVILRTKAGHDTGRNRERREQQRKRDFGRRRIFLAGIRSNRQRCGIDGTKLL
jgi:hypothetical protein